MKHIALVLLILLGSARASANASDTVATSERCSLSVQTGADTAWVIVDSVLRGTTPIALDTLHPGVHTLRLLQKDIVSWPGGVLTDTVVLIAGEQRALRYAFDRTVTIITDPSGALVYMGDSIAGSTPLVLRMSPQDTLRGVVAEKKGFEKIVLTIPPGQSPVARAVLQRSLGAPPPESPLRQESGNSDRIRPRLYVAGALTVISGSAAAFFKLKADNRNALYQLTGDPALKEETRQLDTAAGISLLAAQIGFAFFTYFLLTD